MNNDLENCIQIGDIAIPRSFIVALASLIVGAVAVAFLAHGHREVAGVLGAIAIIGIVNQMRQRSHRGKSSHRKST